MKHFVAIAVFTLVILFLLLRIYDLVFNTSRWSNQIQYGKNCSYVVPAGYRIVYSKEKKKWAVRVLQFNDYYLWNGRFGITTMFSSIDSPALFDDSCYAKGYLKAYLDDQTPRFSYEN